MPSEAYKHFRVNIIDAKRLAESHNELTPNHQGRRALGHITRSGIIMLCASWEVYTESLLVEATKYMANKLDSPNGLPDSVKLNLSKKIKEAKHHLKPLELAGYGWRTVLEAYCVTETQSLNTPKYTKLKKLYSDYIGLDDILDIWDLDSQSIDDFVSIRGKIAHRGRSAPYVTILQLNSYIDMIYNNCKYMDNAMCSYLHTQVGGTTQPWRRATL